MGEITTPQPGLRERKQAETKARIERIAVIAFHEFGYEAVSVDSICDQAEVSQRTFFNYFGSKENVVLGDRLPSLTPERLAEFSAETAPDIIDAMFVLASEAVRPSTSDPELRLMRQEIFAANPQLMRAVFTRMEGLQRTILSALIVRIARARGLAEDNESVVEEARMAVAFTGSAIRFATEDWSEAPSPGNLASVGDQKILLASLRRARSVAVALIVAADQGAGQGAR